MAKPKIKTASGMRQATAAQVRAHYKAIGCKVRIGRDGAVQYKREGNRFWLHGRFVSEYLAGDGYVTLR